MNEAAANALYEAERKGVRQIKGVLRDGRGGMCALGVILEAGLETMSLWETKINGCPMCGATEQTFHRMPVANEHTLIIHLNNDHGLTFAEIARKLGPDAA
jgi:hypothetical protein